MQTTLLHIVIAGVVIQNNVVENIRKQNESYQENFCPSYEHTRTRKFQVLECSQCSSKSAVRLMWKQVNREATRGKVMLWHD